MKTKRTVLWSDHHFDAEAEAELIADFYPEASKDQLISIAYENNQMALEEIRQTLNVHLGNRIFVFADLGLWNGRQQDFQLSTSDCLSSCFYTNLDSAEWYIDGNGDLRCDAYHHDGINHYLYRECKKDFPKGRLVAMVYRALDNKMTREDISCVSNPIGGRIAEIYGFELANEPKKAKERGESR